ncbi:MAG TPA: SUMF1/EgtB/PvdO family nonheme iron enzyme [Blastocatellia bacterium]|nr:SUMF1/EgtB/PvdO family nonheme iron enzyme [Blastocatellia bacterium]
MSYSVQEWVSDWYRPDYYAELAKAVALARNPHGSASSFDPGETGEKKRVQRGGPFLCTDPYLLRYCGTCRHSRNSDVSTGTNHLGFRCVIQP